MKQALFAFLSSNFYPSQAGFECLSMFMQIFWLLSAEQTLDMLLARLMQRNNSPPYATVLLEAVVGEAGFLVEYGTLLRFSM